MSWPWKPTFRARVMCRLFGHRVRVLFENPYLKSLKCDRCGVARHWFPEDEIYPKDAVIRARGEP